MKLDRNMRDIMEDMYVFERNLKWVGYFTKCDTYLWKIDRYGKNMNKNVEKFYEIWVKYENLWEIKINFWES